MIEVTKKTYVRAFDIYDSPFEIVGEEVEVEVETSTPAVTHDSSGVTTFLPSDVGRTIIGLQDRPARGVSIGETYTITEIQSDNHAQINATSGSGVIAITHLDKQWAFYSPPVNEVTTETTIQPSTIKFYENRDPRFIKISKLGEDFEIINTEIDFTTLSVGEIVNEGSLRILKSGMNVDRKELAFVMPWVFAGVAGYGYGL